ncbi:MAG: BamA/TamA family outer membrane protein, partial [Polyangiaceae bacterium]
MTVIPDKPATFGKILIEGLGSLPETPVRRALDLKEGAPYSASELESAQQAALDLGVFASVAMLPQLGDPPPESHIVPVIVRVEPAKLRTVKLGGGVEIDGIKTDVHALFRWENRNFLGGLRSFSASFRPGLVLYPTRIDNLVTPTDILPTERLRLELRQPGFLEARTTGFFRPEFNIFPLLLRAAGSPDPNVPVPGYRELKGALGVDRTFWRFFYANLSQNVQMENPFTYKGALDPNVRSLFLSYPALITNFDFRDDRVHPHKGIYIGNEVQLAGLIGDAQDVRITPEIRGYVPLSRRVTLASRIKLGFLFPGNYGSHIDPATGLPAQGATTGDWARDLQLIFFRGFYSGGPTSNRGYALGDVGPHGAVPFFDPGLDARQYQKNCDAGSPTYSAANCAVPLKGLTLWEASLEVRFPLFKNFEGATFCDTSDVSPRRTEIRLSHLHLSCGIGGRYETPVGPIRLDLGYRIVEIIGAQDVIQCAAVVNGRCVADAPLQSTQEGVHSKIFGLP